MELIVDLPKRHAKQRAHTATHLLHYMLDQLLSGTKQAGSLVDDDYLRFDFAAKEPLSQEQIIHLEQEVNSRIFDNCAVSITEMSLDEAKKTGAKAFFEDKYGDIVRVIQVPTSTSTIYTGDSTEFCGGTHVSSTGMIGAFKITNQEAVASGVRRLEAVTGPLVARYAQEKEQEQYTYAQLLDCSPKQLAEKIQKLLGTVSVLQQEVTSLQTDQILGTFKLITPNETDDFTYTINSSSLGITLPLKSIVPHLRVLRPETNRLLYTNDGQFALCADNTKNAKELQQRFGLKGGGDNQLIQGKDLRVLEVI